MADYSKIIDKIRKLFALSKSPNENEAALALEKARELMLQYNIEQTQIDDSVEDIIEIDFNLAQSSVKYSFRFAYWLGRAFMVRAIGVNTVKFAGDTNRETSIRFIGKMADVAVATFVFAYIMDILNTKSTEYCKSIKKKSDKIKSEYSLGFITAVCLKLEEMEKKYQEEHPASFQEESDQINALMVIRNALINRYMEDKYKDKIQDNITQKEKFNPKNFDAGFAEGEKQGIFRGVEGTTDSKQMLEV